ncbi:MAG: hypothetical protein Tsb005_05210 [Gammaproteobacteria bacterium]
MVLWYSQHIQIKQVQRKFLLVMLACLIVKILLPQITISEGHNVYLPVELKHSHRYKELPSDIHRQMKAEFLNYYPTHTWCDRRISNCWLNSVIPNAPYAFSSDSIFQHAIFSRTVDQIDFNSLANFRAGFPNSNGNLLGNYNWLKLDRMDRKHLPFFVMYQLPQELVGSQLCWQGQVFWPITSTTIKNSIFSDVAALNNKQCRLITQTDVGSKIYGFDFGEAQPLSMQLHLKFYWHVVNTLKVILVFSILFGLSLLCKLDWKNLMPTVGLLLIALIYVVMRGQLTFFFNHNVLAGTNDGLVYTGFGREIVFHLAHGQWLQALRGGVDIFYYMPGMRYFRALEKLMFGESDIGMLLALIMFYISFGKLLLSILSQRFAWFLYFIVVVATGHTILFLATHGLSEVPAAACLFGALSYLINARNKMATLDATTLNKTAGYAGLLIALAIFFRPNFLLAVGLAAMIFMLSLVYYRQPKALLIFCLGGSLSAIALIHNGYFGSQLILFTNSAFDPVNLRATPLHYIYALMNVFGIGHHAAISANVLHQLTMWIRSPIKLICLLLAVFFVIKKTTFNIRLLALIALGLQIPFMFYDADMDRHLFIPWLVTYLVGVVGLVYLFQGNIKQHLINKRAFVKSADLS